MSFVASMIKLKFRDDRTFPLEFTGYSAWKQSSRCGKTKITVTKQGDLPTETETAAMTGEQMDAKATPQLTIRTRLPAGACLLFHARFN